VRRKETVAKGLPFTIHGANRCPDAASQLAARERYASPRAGPRRELDGRGDAGGYPDAPRQDLLSRNPG
jgi:hypothetical protein